MTTNKTKAMLDYDFERLAEEHIDVWKDRYFGKTRQEIISDLDINYDWSVELEDNNVSEADEEEFKYEFTREVLRQLGFEMSQRNKERLEWCINNTDGKVQDELTKLYEDLVY